MKPQFVFVEPHVVGMKNVCEPMVCFFLKENRQRQVRIVELRKRRPSVSASQQTGEVQLSASSLRARLEQSVSAVREDDDSVETCPLIGETTVDGQDTEQQGDTVAEETLQTTEDRDNQTRTERNRSRDCHRSPTLQYNSSTVLVLAALLIGVTAVAVLAIGRHGVRD